MHLVRKVQEQTPVEIACGIMKKLTWPQDCHSMDFAHVTINGSTKRHYHIKATEVYYVLKGSVEVELGNRKKEYLGPGSLLMIYPKTEHKAYSKPGDPAEILVISSPPWSEGDEILTE